MRNKMLMPAFSIEPLERRALLSVPANMTLNILPPQSAHVALVAHPSAKPAVPASPTDLVQGSSTSSSITLHWTDNSTDESGFRIDRWNGRKWVTIKRLGVNVTSYIDKGLKPGTPYAYIVYAYNSGGLSASPAFIGDAITLPVGGIALPSNLTASVLSPAHTILQFTDNATNELGYNVQYSTGGAAGPWAFAGGVAGTTGTGARSFDFTGAQAGQTYSFRLAPYTATQFFDYTPAATATAPVSGARNAVLSNGQFYTVTNSGGVPGGLTLNRFNPDSSVDTTFGTNGSIVNFIANGVYPSSLTFPAGLPNGQVLGIRKQVGTGPNNSHTLGLNFVMSPDFASSNASVPFSFAFSDDNNHNFSAFPPEPRIFVEPDGKVLIATNMYKIAGDPTSTGGPQLTLLNADLSKKWAIALPSFPDSVAGLVNGFSTVTTGSTVTVYDANGNQI